MTPAERLAVLRRLDRVIRERNTWTDLRALGAYEDLWEMAYGAACLAAQVAAAARYVVERDGTWEPAEQATPHGVEPTDCPACGHHLRSSGSCPFCGPDEQTQDGAR